MSRDLLLRVLETARWAPSGDNTQPWRFELVDGERVVVHGHDTRDHVVYDLDGRASQLSLGALLETLTVAATGLGLRCDVSRRLGMPAERPTFDLRLKADPSVVSSVLLPQIPRRSVHRGWLSVRPLQAGQQQWLQSLLDPGYRLLWIEGLAARMAMARLLFANARLRLTLREAFDVHRSVIDWGQRFSADRIPEFALGASPLLRVVMRWGMQDWRRVDLANRFLAGTWMPRLEMDLLPALLCGAHVAIQRTQPPDSIDDHVECGRQVQRLWLGLSHLGIQHQPEVTPLIFARFAASGLAFSQDRRHLDTAKNLAHRLQRLMPCPAEQVVWLGRAGYGRPTQSRSVRLDMAQLLR